MLLCCIALFFLVSGGILDLGSGGGGGGLDLVMAAMDDLIVPFCTKFAPNQRECFDEAGVFSDYPEDRLCFRGVSDLLLLSRNK